MFSALFLLRTQQKIFRSRGDRLTNNIKIRVRLQNPQHRGYQLTSSLKDLGCRRQKNRTRASERLQLFLSNALRSNRRFVTQQMCSLQQQTTSHSAFYHCHSPDQVSRCCYTSGLPLPHRTLPVIPSHYTNTHLLKTDVTIFFCSQNQNLKNDKKYTYNLLLKQQSSEFITQSIPPFTKICITKFHMNFYEEVNTLHLTRHPNSLNRNLPNKLEQVLTKTQRMDSTSAICKTWGSA